MTGFEERTRLRLGVVAVVVFAMFTVLLGRLWFLQVLAGDTYAEAATQNHVRLVSIEAPRGRILDRNGNVLVKNRPALAVGIRKDDLPDDPKEARVVKRRLARLLGISARAIDRRLADVRTSPYKPVVIKEDVPREVVFTVRERQAEYPGAETLVVPVRQYPYGRLASHVLGYVGETNERELERLKGYRLGDAIGRTGVERAYEKWLRGSPGLQKLEVDAVGRVLRVLGQRDAQPGADLVLSLDAGLQRAAEEALRDAIRLARSRFDRETGRRFRAPAGAIVVLEPKTGDVLALASHPTFDLRKFVGGVDDEYWKFLNDPNHHNPLLNRALQAGYAPGSTYKAVVASAGLGSGAASVRGGYPCRTEFRFGTGVFRNWRPRNATISLAQSLVESCDTVYYLLGRNWWLKERRAEEAGRKVAETMQEWSRIFGLGKATGIDLPNEIDGVVPGRATRMEQWKRNRAQWCARYRRTREIVWEDLCERGFIWRGGDAVNMSIGQGELQATPLQMAVAYSAIANGGKVVRPHVGMEVRAPEGSVLHRVKTRVRTEVPASRSALRYVRNALTQVPVRGTATSAFVGWPFDDIPVAAKTGSSQVAGKQTYSWFASFAPADRPQYVAVAVVEQAGSGSQVAGPAVRRVLDVAFGLPPRPIIFGQRSD